MILWLLAVGLVTILGQVVLLRELNVAFYGSELIYILAMGVWLLWTAVGAAAGRRATLPPAARVRAGFLCYALLLLASLVFIRALRPLFGAVPGAYLPFPRQLLAMTLALLPIGLLGGLLFQWVAKRYVGEERTLALAYGIECIGGLTGGGAATLLLRWGAQNLETALLCGLAALTAACLPWGRDRPRWLAPAAVPVLVLLAAGLALSGRLDDALTRINHPSLAASLDTPYGRVTVTSLRGQLSVFSNDALAFENQGTGAEEFVHLAALQVERPERILVLGGGVEGIVREALKHRPAQLDYVELDEAYLGLVRGHLPDEERAALGAEEVTVAVADPRAFLRRAGGYDLILVGMPEPDSAQSNRFYTWQFFGLCSDRLREGGVLAFRVRSAENLWTPALTRRTASIHGAARLELGDILVLPGTTNVILASNDRLVRDPEVLEERWEERGIDARLVSPPYLRYMLTNDRVGEIERLLRATRAPANTDARPICYQFTLMLWLSRFFPVLAMLDMPGGEGGTTPGDRLRLAEEIPWVGLLLAAAGAALLFLLLRWRVPLRRMGLVFMAGLIGMVLETALILNYQVKSGVLYQDLGLLLALFMAGLALGALATHRGHARVPALGWGAGAGLLAVLAIFSLLVAMRLSRGVLSGLFSSGSHLFLAGALVGALFAFASLHRVKDQRATVSPLYAADVLGGCVGSVVATLVLIPFLGLPGTALLIGLLALACLPLL